jgi:hypothetical protein
MGAKVGLDTLGKNGMITIPTTLPQLHLELTMQLEVAFIKKITAD